MNIEDGWLQLQDLSGIHRTSPVETATGFFGLIIIMHKDITIMPSIRNKQILNNSGQNNIAKGAW